MKEGFFVVIGPRLVPGVYADLSCPCLVSQKIVTFTPDPGFVPENASEFFTDATHNKWLGMVPRKSSLSTVPDSFPYISPPMYGF